MFLYIKELLDIVIVTSDAFAIDEGETSIEEKLCSVRPSTATGGFQKDSGVGLIMAEMHHL